MFVSRCDPDRTTRGSAFKYSCALEKNKLFVKGIRVNFRVNFSLVSPWPMFSLLQKCRSTVSLIIKIVSKGLPLTMTKEQIEELFGAHGALKEVRVVTYRNGHSKGLAYVEFENEADASKALLATDGTTIEDKVINVAVSKPPERKKVSTNDDIAQIKSLGGTTTSRTGFNAPRKMLAMIPRSVIPMTKNGSAGTSDKIGEKKPISNADFRNMLLSNKK